MKKLLLPFIAGCFIVNFCNGQVGKTEITRWQGNKNGAVSITWDDGSINQFKVALPMLNRYNFPGTFFIITGQIPGSQYHGKFIGRPVKDIIAETASIPTNKNNLFERASAASYLGLVGPMDYYYNAGSLVDAGKTDEAIRIIDELYSKVRNGDFKAGVQHNPEYMDAHGTTWGQIRKYAAQGHEFASHMITHPRLAILDEVNMKYEMEKSKLDILNHLGAKYTFAGEGPFGTENERAMQYAYKIYPALRNRMPEPWLKEISRSDKSNPGNTDKEYIQFQRGATTKTPLSMMKAWVDTTLNKNNTWLVLTIHGVEGIGWEALPAKELDEYFAYIKARGQNLWVATFGDVTRYMRERQSAKLSTRHTTDKITVKLQHPLNKAMYNIPLTLKTYVPQKWKGVKMVQGSTIKIIKPIVKSGEKGPYILYSAKPNGEGITLTVNNQ